MSTLREQSLYFIMCRSDLQRRKGSTSEVWCWCGSNLHVLPHRFVLGQDTGGVERGGGNNHGLLRRENTRGRELDGCRNRQPAQKVDRGRPYVDPGVVHELCDGHSLIGVCLQQQADQVFG